MKKHSSAKNEHQSKYLNLLIFIRRPCQVLRSAFSHPPLLRRAQVAFTKNVRKNFVEPLGNRVLKTEKFLIHNIS